MKVFLVEVVIGKKLEPISLQTSFKKAVKLIGDRVGIITGMFIDKVYPGGIGVCEHWHLGEKKT